MLDVHDKACQWDLAECPDNLYFNHGQFKKDGISHIINEIQSKSSSNRALYSLINQSDISNSGDNPIPSFMLFQCILEDKILYCTVYFRALEVSQFLRINLEEIRMNLEKIYDSSISFDSVRILILACRAHHTPNFIPLEKPKIDLLSSMAIFNILDRNPSEMHDLLNEKSNTQSVICYQAFEEILDFIKCRWPLDNKGKIESLLEKSIKNCKTLQELRKIHSHSNKINKLTTTLADDLRKLAGEFK